jgi:hypothetical protein
MSAKKKDLPGWFPFAMATTVVVGLLSGARSRWKLLEPESPPAPPEPGVKGSGSSYEVYWP